MLSLSSVRELIAEPDFALLPVQPAACLHRQRHQHLSTTTGTLHCHSTTGNYCHLKRNGMGDGMVRVRVCEREADIMKNVKTSQWQEIL